MEHDAQSLRDKAARYRRLLTDIDDKRAKDTLSALIVELKAKADATEKEDLAAALSQQKRPQP